MQILEEYKRSLKMAEAEEILDLIFYRPIAYVIVKLIYRLPITPNQVTLISLICGLAAGYNFARVSSADVSGFAWGALWYAIANVFDCGDGMLARLQKSGTPFGRLVDGIVDWLVSTAIFIGLGIGMQAWTGSIVVWLLVLPAAFLSAYHAMVFDKRQQEYITAVKGEEDFIGRELVRIEKEIDHLKSTGGGTLRRIGLQVYLFYMNVQGGNATNEPPAKKFPPDRYASFNRRIMKWWTWLGPTTNRTLLMIACALTRPDLFCWVVVIPANLYLVGMRFWQRYIDRQLETAHSSSAPPASSAV